MITFEDFWAIYPRKVAKAAAGKAWQRAIENRGAKPEVMIAGAVRYRDWLEQSSREHWRPEAAHAATWLNGERWDDVLASETNPRPYGPRGVFAPEAPIDPAVQDRVGRMMRELADKLRANREGRE